MLAQAPTAAGAGRTATAGRVESAPPAGRPVSATTAGRVGSAPPAGRPVSALPLLSERVHDPDRAVPAAVLEVLRIEERESVDLGEGPEMSVEPR
jgi:hypothetical protein